MTESWEGRVFGGPSEEIWVFYQGIIVGSYYCFV